MIGDICVHQRKKHLLNFEAEIVCYFIECVYKVFFFFVVIWFLFHYYNHSQSILSNGCARLCLWIEKRISRVPFHIICANSNIRKCISYCMIRADATNDIIANIPLYIYVLSFWLCMCCEFCEWKKGDRKPIQRYG